MLPSNKQYDLVIVGAGMVGAALAARLGQLPATRGLTVALVEASPKQATFSAQRFDPRVVALSKASQSLLQAIGVWPAVLANRACPYYSMNIWDAEGTGNIQFHCEEVHEENLGHIVENSLLVCELWRKLNELENIELVRDCRVVDWVAPAVEQGDASLRLESESKQCEITASVVIAADGANSPLRAMAGLETREWDYGQSAIVTTVSLAEPHQHTCWQRFTRDGPIAFLPLQESAGDNAEQSRTCSLVWSATTELANTLMAMDEQAFNTALGKAFEYRLGEVEKSDRRFCIPLRQRHAKQYIKPGIALLGDAAHTIHPLAGQGVNLGFYDVQAMVAELARACERGIGLADFSVLRRYQRQRQSHNLSAMLTMEGFKRLFAADDPAIRWLRNTGMNVFNSQFLIKQQLARVAAGQL